MRIRKYILVDVMFGIFKHKIFQDKNRLHYSTFNYETLLLFSISQYKNGFTKTTNRLSLKLRDSNLQYFTIPVFT